MLDYNSFILTSYRPIDYANLVRGEYLVSVHAFDKNACIGDFMFKCFVDVDGRPGDYIKRVIKDLAILHCNLRACMFLRIVSVSKV